VRLAILYNNCLEIQTPKTLGACPGLYRVTFSLKRLKYLQDLLVYVQVRV